VLLCLTECVWHGVLHYNQVQIRIVGSDHEGVFSLHPLHPPSRPSTLTPSQSLPPDQEERPSHHGSRIDSCRPKWEGSGRYQKHVGVVPAAGTTVLRQSYVVIHVEGDASPRALQLQRYVLCRSPGVRDLEPNTFACCRVVNHQLVM
jgi:hypothetical protein